MNEPGQPDNPRQKNIIINSTLVAEQGDIRIGDDQYLLKEIGFQNVFHCRRGNIVNRDFFYPLQENVEFDPFVGNARVDNIFREICHNDRLVILGEAGLGKSVELERIASVLTKEYNIPIAFIKLRDIGEGDVVPFFKIRREDLESSVDKALLIDGLDEININKAKRIIEDVCRGVPNLKVIVSCRANIYTGQLDGFRTLFIDRLSEDQFDQFLEKRLGSEDAVGFKDAISSPDLKFILTNPFYLDKAIIYFSNNSRTLPESKVDLLKYFIFESLNIRLGDESKITSKKHTRERCLRALRKVAFVAEAMGRNQLTIEEFKSLIVSEELIELVFINSSLIHGGDRDKVQFYHRMFQEFFAAEVLSNVKSIKRLKRVVCSSSGKHVVNRSWINALSYLMSFNIVTDDFKKELLSWLLKTNPKVLTKFEGGSVLEVDRVSVVENILDELKNNNETFDYKSTDPNEIVSFCQSNQAFFRLMERFKYSQNELDKRNVLKLLASFNPVYAKSDIKGELFGKLLDEVKTSLEPYFRHLATDVIVRLYQAISVEEAQTIADQFFDSKRSSYDRLSAYRMINLANIHKPWLERLLRRLIEIDEDKFSTGFTLGDESFYLQKCIEGVKQKESILSYFELFIPVFKENSHYHGRIFFNDFMKKIFELNLTEEDHSKVFASVKEIVFYSSGFDLNNVISDCIQFVEFAGKQTEFISYCITRAAEYPQRLIVNFFTPQAFKLIVDAFQSGLVDDQWVNNLIGWLHHKDRELESRFVAHLNTETNSTFQVREEISIPIETVDERKERRFKEELDLLCSLDTFIQSIELIFDDLGIERLGDNKIHKLVHSRPRVSWNIFYELHPEIIIRTVTQNSSLTKQELIQKVSDNWTYYSIRQIELKLRNWSGFKLNLHQRAYVTQWCDEHAKNVSLSARITNGDRSFFFFVVCLRLLHYPPQLYLNGIQNGELGAISEQQNLIYLAKEIDEIALSAIELSLANGLQLNQIKGFNLHVVLKFIEVFQFKSMSEILFNIIGDQELNYRYQGLQAYLACDGETSRLINTLKETPATDDFEDHLINALLEKEPVAVQDVLTQRFHSTNDQVTKLRYAKYLINFSKKDALKYLLEFTKTEKKSPFIHDWPGGLRVLTSNISSIPLLLKFYSLAFDPKVEQRGISMIAHRVRATLSDLATKDDFKNIKLVVNLLRFWLWKEKMQDSILRKVGRQSEKMQRSVNSLRHFIDYLIDDYHQQQRMTFEEARSIYRKLMRKYD